MIALSRPEAAPVKAGFIDRCARRLLARSLASLRHGTVTIESESQVDAFGEADDLQATIMVHDPRFFRRAILGGTLSVGESYLCGEWDCTDLVSLFRIIIRNMELADGMDRGIPRLISLGSWLVHLLRDNSRRGSQKNISAHYDLGNEFFRLWLDESLAYSSAIFPVSGASLYEASLEKFDRACRKLDLQSSDHLLEIGSGWGGMAIHAASDYGCRVTTTTISREQFSVAGERIRQAGLQDRIDLLLQDYRDLTGTFDKLVSIEMLEAVGHRHFDTYFGQCSRLLKPTGSLVVQAIMLPERRYPQYLKSVDFIQKYVFPGGCLPSLAAVLEAAGRTTDLRLVHAEDFAPHYAETLRRWRDLFQARLPEVRSLGYSDRFIRLWSYYLCYCEALFEERHVGVMQIQFDKPRCRRDPIELSSAAARMRYTTKRAESTVERASDRSSANVRGI